MKRLLRRLLGIPELEARVKMLELAIFVPLPMAENQETTGTLLSPNEIAVVKGYDRH